MQNVSNIKIIITEPTDIDNTKSVGCWFIENAVKKAGYDISYVPFDELKSTQADIYLFSVHHVRDIFYIHKIEMWLKNKIVIAGGHTMNNPYPFLRYFDAICVGEGEEWILKALSLFSKGIIKNDYISSLEQLEGTITNNIILQPIKKIYVQDISINEHYLNKSQSKGHSDIWYIETARGCKSKCYYCELGWTSKYRENSAQKITCMLQEIKKSQTKKVNIFAPDDFSFSNYNETLQQIFDLGLQTDFGSMRVDSFEKMNITQKKNFLFRVGIDGVSERIRRIINKPISDNNIIELITGLVEKGFVNFKMFMIFSYPFEKTSDFSHFERLISIIEKEVEKLKRTVFLRLKFTPFIPNPLTPMDFLTPNYNIETRKRIDMFFMQKKYQRSNVVIVNEGILEPYSYYTQTMVTRGYTDLPYNMFKNRKMLNFISEGHAKKTDCERINIETNIPKEVRKKASEKLKKTIENELQNNNYS